MSADERLGRNVRLLGRALMRVLAIASGAEHASRARRKMLGPMVESYSVEIERWDIISGWWRLYYGATRITQGPWVSYGKHRVFTDDESARVLFCGCCGMGAAQGGQRDAFGAASVRSRW